MARGGQAKKHPNVGQEIGGRLTTLPWQVHHAKVCSRSYSLKLLVAALSHKNTDVATRACVGPAAIASSATAAGLPEDASEAAAGASLVALLQDDANADDAQPEGDTGHNTMLLLIEAKDCHGFSLNCMSGRCTSNSQHCRC